MLLSDVGGIYGILISFASTTLAIINYQKPKNLLAEHLFSAKKDEKLKADKQYACKEYLLSCLPKCCQMFCLKKTK